MSSGVKHLDSVVENAIQWLFLAGTVPDKNNSLPDGSQYKAPDHQVLDGCVLIERKSLNARDDGRLFNKFVRVAAEQGRTFWGYGRGNMRSAVERLPDPKSANLKMTDYMLNQLKKDIGKARKKFEQHALRNPGEGFSRILIISDQSEISFSTDFVEYSIRELFLRDRGGQVITGLIDSIIYVKYPWLVRPAPQSFWYKCLIRKSAWNTDRLKWVAYRLYQVLCAEINGRAPPDPDRDCYRALLV